MNDRKVISPRRQLGSKRTTTRSVLTSLDELILAPSTAPATPNRSTTGGRQSFMGLKAYTKNGDFSVRKLQRRDSYIARLNSINPSYVIDKLKDEKRLMERENVSLQQKLDQTSDQIEKRKKQMADFAEMQVKGGSDKKEMFRDASVF